MQKLNVKIKKRIYKEEDMFRNYAPTVTFYGDRRPLEAFICKEKAE